MFHRVFLRARGSANVATHKYAVATWRKTRILNVVVLKLLNIIRGFPSGVGENGDFPTRICMSQMRSFFSNSYFFNYPICPITGYLQEENDGAKHGSSSPLLIKSFKSYEVEPTCMQFAPSASNSDPGYSLMSLFPIIEL